MLLNEPTGVPPIEDFFNPVRSVYTRYDTSYVLLASPFPRLPRRAHDALSPTFRPLAPTRPASTSTRICQT